MLDNGQRRLHNVSVVKLKKGENSMGKSGIES